MYSSTYTGIGRYVYELVEQLKKIDKKNKYVLFFNEPEYSKFKDDAPNFKKVLVNAKHYTLNEQINFLKLLNKEKLDLMHFTHFNAPVLYKAPSIVTIHDLTLSFYPGKKMTSIHHRLAYHLTLSSAVNKAKKVIAVSENTKQDLIRLLNTDPEKISVIYEGVNDDFKPIRQESQLAEVKEKYKLDKPYLLYTGVWRSHKNLPNLIKAFHILKSEYEFDGYLVITGRRDPVYEEEVVGETQTLQLENDVIFTGSVPDEDLIKLYCAASVYVFPSLYEGFGLPPLEAMQCGIPVCASDTSCTPEICGEENALFFNPHSPESIADKIYQVLSSQTLRNKLIQNGFERVNTFSWEKMAQETLKIYNSLEK